MGRWTIAGMLALIAAIAVSLSAIRDATLVWAAVIPFLSGATLTLALIRAILRREQRAVWLGFVGVGIPYFILAVLLAPVIGPLPLISPWIDSITSRLDPPPPPIRDVWLPRAEWIKLPLEERRARAIMISQDSEKDRVYTRDLMTRREATRSIAQSLLSLLLGSLGGLLASLAAWPGRFGQSTKKVMDSCP